MEWTQINYSDRQYAFSSYGNEIAEKVDNFTVPPPFREINIGHGNDYRLWGIC